MTISVTTATLQLLRRMLKNLDQILEQAAAYAAERKFDPDNYVGLRLAPDMHGLKFQVTSAADHSKFALARLSGKTPPVWEDNEKTFADLRARVQKAIDYAATFTEADLAGGDERKVTIKVSGVDTEMTGGVYYLQRALPNFMFHVTTAYDILRHAGVPVGKRHFLGPIEA